MNKCSPVEMRKNLEVVEVFRKNGVDFVAVPVIDEQHKTKLLQESMEFFSKIVESNLDEK